jgi:hypothetical protein
MRSGDRSSLGRCSILAGTVTIEALRGRNSLFGSDVDGEKMLVSHRALLASRTIFVTTRTAT